MNGRQSPRVPRNTYDHRFCGNMPRFFRYSNRICMLTHLNVRSTARRYLFKSLSEIDKNGSNFEVYIIIIFGVVSIHSKIKAIL